MNNIEEPQGEKYVPFETAMPLAPHSRDALLQTVNPDAPHWNIWTALGLWFLSVALIFSTAIVAICGYFLFHLAVSGKLPEQANLAENSNLIALNLAAIFPAHILTVVAAWSLLTRNGRQSFWQTLGWRWNGFGFWACLLTTIALYGIGIGIISLTGEQENDLVRILRSSRTAVFLTAIMATFTAPLVEEVVYRGILYPAFRLQLGAPSAILLVTLLFAAVHVPQYVEFDKLQSISTYGTITVIIILSLVLTLIRARTGNLLPCFVIHTLFNGVQSLLLVFEPYLPKTLAPPDPTTAAILRFFSLQ